MMFVLGIYLLTVIHTLHVVIQVNIDELQTNLRDHTLFIAVNWVDKLEYQYFLTKSKVFRQRTVDKVRLL